MKTVNVYVDGRPNMLPVLGGEVVESQKHVPVLGQAYRGLVVLPLGGTSPVRHGENDQPRVLSRKCDRGSFG